MRFLPLRAVCLLLSAVLSSFSTSGLAQQVDSEEGKPTGATSYRGAQYFLGAEDELLMRVNIWGFVRKPGQYMVPTDTDLISLMSFAGGPIEQAKVKSVKIVRAPAVASSATGVERGLSGGINQSHGAALAPGARLEEVASASRPRVHKVNVKAYLEHGRPEMLPPLLPGDTIVVEGTAMNTVNKFLDFASKLAFIGQVYFWISVANR